MYCSTLKNNLSIFNECYNSTCDLQETILNNFFFFLIFLNNCILTVHLKLQWWSVTSDKPLQKQSRLTFTVVLSILSQLFDRKCWIESLKETHHTSLSVSEYKVCILTTPCVFSAVQTSSSRPHVLKAMYACFEKKPKPWSSTGLHRLNVH